MPNATQSWTYDAAGNRNDSVCDNLNRAASIGGVACTNDILGNRLTKGSTSYTWDDLNRMTKLAVDQRLKRVKRQPHLKLDRALKVEGAWATPKA